MNSTAKLLCSVRTGSCGYRAPEATDRNLYDAKDNS